MNKFKQKFTSYLKGQGFSATVLVAIIIAAVVLVNVIIYTVTAVIPRQNGAGGSDDFTISDSSDALFEPYIASGERVTLTFCSYEDVVSTHTTGSSVLKTAREFEKNYPGFVTLRFVNAVTKLDSDGKSVAEELEIYKNEGKNIIDETTVIFSTESRYRVITDLYTAQGYSNFYTLDDQKMITSYNGEEMIASSILWVLTENHGVAYMTVGHGETANITLYNILTAAGYEVRDINLRKSEIPEDAELLIISNPTADFERAAEGSSIVAEYDRLRAYQRRGGHFFIALNSYAKALPVLEGFIADFGISISKNDDGEKLLIKDSANAITTDGFTLVADYADSTLASDMQAKITERTDSSGAVVIRNVVALGLDSAKPGAMPLLLSSSSSVCEAAGSTVSSDGNYVIAAASTLQNDMADEAKMFVMSDGMLTSGDAIVSNGYSNKDFLYSLFDVFYEKGDMPYGCGAIVLQTQILENLTMGDARAYAAVLLLIPVAIAATGAVLLRRRKNR